MPFEDMSPLVRLLSFVVTWGLGLTPPLIARYAWFKQPLPRKKANWIAGINSVVFWLIFLFVNAAAGETRPGNGVAWIFVFLVSRWIMNRGHPDAADQGKGSSSKRQNMVRRLEEIIADPATPETERESAVARLKALEK